MLWWIFVLFFVAPVIITILLSYQADKQYWKQRVQDGGWSWQQFKDDVKHFEEKEP